ncbi:MAG: hydrolase [Chitinivibrionales bacterium]|nr:hydrolase [Chitinivibrionales bacterium]MBD3394309.1 hydrolase [Chitinivibrionales bacterium]
MRTIVCFGDSNTWGHDPASGERFPADVRWPGVLQAELGSAYRVIEEGQCGRTTVWDDPIEGQRNGKDYLMPCLESHRPLDLVIVMLGTNDLKMRFSVSAEDIAKGAAVLAAAARASTCGPDAGPPEVLLVAPPIVKGLTEYAEMFEGAEQKSHRLAGHYRAMAELHGCYFLDAGSVVEPSPLDGVHLEASEHLKLGMVLAERVQKIFGASPEANAVA